MVGSLKRSNKKYSYADYLGWQDDKRREIIDGIIYDMNAPLRLHQKLITELLVKFHLFLKDKNCEVYAAPFDVRLPGKSKKNEDIFNVVQPDISVICDEDKLDEKGCVGAPDLIIEIISPSTASVDHIKKRALYESVGVKEYWLVDPSNRIVTIYKQKAKNGFAKPEVYYDKSQVEVELFPGLTVNLEEVFPKLPQVVCENLPPGYGQ